MKLRHSNHLCPRGHLHPSAFMLLLCQVFVDGALVYGGNADVAVTTAAQASASHKVQQQQLSNSCQTSAPCSSSSRERVEAIAGVVHASSSWRPSAAGTDGTAAVGSASRVTAATSAPGASSSSSGSGGGSLLYDLTGSPTWASRRGNVAALLEQLVGFPQPPQQPSMQQQCAQEHQQLQAAGCSAQPPTESPPQASGTHAGSGTAAVAAAPHIKEPPTGRPAAAAAAEALHEKELLLCRLLCGILNDSGVLPKLLAVQMRDVLDIQGIEQLYVSLLGGMLQQQQQLLQEEQQAAATAAVQHGSNRQVLDGCTKQQQQQQRNHSPADELLGHDQDSNSAPQQLRQHQRQQYIGGVLLPASRQQQLALLRDYLTAATAKDCAIMVTAQQVVQQQQQQVHPCDGCAAATRRASVAAQQGGNSIGLANTCQYEHLELQEHTGSHAVESSETSSSDSSRYSSFGGLYVDAPSGCSFAWQLSLVDLDLKPLTKVPQHSDLDRTIVAAALRHEQQLQQHVEFCERWMRVWLDQQNQRQQQQQPC